jgi:hypothetical protein
MASAHTAHAAPCSSFLIGLSFVLRRRSARLIGSEYPEHTIVVQACVAE